MPIANAIDEYSIAFMIRSMIWIPEEVPGGEHVHVTGMALVG